MRTYIAIDLKSFYASVECVEQNLNPLTTNLVVADASRTEKTICLAVSPSLKAYGIPGRARLFEVIQKVRQINALRRSRIPEGEFRGASSDAEVLNAHPEYELTYIAARPRMALYIEYSTRIYQIYLKYVAPEDIHVYSIDEVFMDVTAYLKIYDMTPRELASKMVREVLTETGITATAGIGTNLYLAKIAMDIVAKHIPADEHNVRIAELDEEQYRRQLWTHRPITDFWRVGRGFSRKLEANGMYTMGDVARCAVNNEELLFHLFGVNAELLMDHAFGYEPCRIEDIRKYKPENNSLGSGQVLQHPYPFEKGKLVVREMTDLLVLDLVEKKMVTDQMVLTIGYDRTNLENKRIAETYIGEVTTDHYGRRVPKPAHGSINLGGWTSSTRKITEAVTELFDRIADPALLIRRINLTAAHVVDERRAEEKTAFEQMNLFSDFGQDEEKKKEDAALEKERKAQGAILEIRRKFGKNAVLRGMNLEEGATAAMRNQQIGGHKA
uniref:Y-family DNA polymerase n=1 Tax=Eubacterium cellulosolvens TaxID=29322 RepID=UPI0004899900|nr:DNA methylase [[Eubacterium] cellulosolvens]